MHERNFDGHQDFEAKLVEWFNTPTVLASSSSYRASVLRDVGFRYVEQVEISDEQEKKFSDNLLSGGSLMRRGVEDDPNDAKLAAIIATAKIRMVEKSIKDIDSKFIFAADTCVELSSLHYNIDGDFVGGHVEYLFKPLSREDAKKNIIKILENLIINITFLKSDFSEIARRVNDTKKMIQLTKEAVVATYIKVNTATAIKFPHTDRIETINSILYLLPRTLLDVVEGRVVVKLEDLAEDLLVATEESGISPVNIAGGINYADQRVRDILDIEEISRVEVEEGVYRGAPKNAISKFLRSKTSQ